MSSGCAFGTGKVFIELRPIDPSFGEAPFAKGRIDKRHEVAQPEQADRLQPARPGLIFVFGRPLVMEPDQKFPVAIPPDSALPGEKGCGTEQCFADEAVDRPVGDQGKQRFDLAIEYTCDDSGERFGDGVAKQGGDLVEWLAQQAQKRLAGFAVAGRA